jgi:hypothetical protein
MNVEPEIDASVVQYSEFDQLKEKYIIAFINDCKDRNIRLIFSVSPWYKGDRFTHRQFLCIESLCCKYNIPFVYSFGQAEITENKKMFKDVAHLNDLGATAFTSSFVTKIKPLVSIQNRTLTE